MKIVSFETRPEYIEATYTGNGVWGILGDDENTIIETITTDKLREKYNPYDGEWCEACGEYIDVYEDEYTYDVEGICFCKKCSEEE